MAYQKPHLKMRSLGSKYSHVPPPIQTKIGTHEYLIGILVQEQRPVTHDGSWTPPPIPGHAPFGRMDSVGNTPVKTVDGRIFDIVDTYERILRDDPDITMPVAAIEALAELLAATDASTVYETLDLVDIQSAWLKTKIPNSISLTAGIHIFRQFIVASLKPQSNFSGNFEALRRHLIKNTTLFVERAKKARESIANIGLNFVRDGHTVMTHGGSRVAGALLVKAAAMDRKGGNVRFQVIYVMSEVRKKESKEIIASLRAAGVPVAEIPESAVAFCMNKVDLIIVGAEGVVENGGIISRMGTYQLAVIAHAHDKLFYVAAETHKFVRMFPLGQDDLGPDQKIMVFKTEDDDAAPPANAIDYTHPKYISALITEVGVKTTSAVSEELCSIHFN